MKHGKLMAKSAFEEQVAHLKERYAYQFREPHIGHYICPGWLNLVSRLCEAADALLTPHEREAFHWVQIKEKFGTLRAYWEGGPVSIDFLGENSLARIEVTCGANAAIDQATSRRLHALVRKAERQSARTCLFCGAAGGSRRTRGWIVTACDECDKSRRRFSDENES